MSRPSPERPGDLIPEAMEFAGWPPLGVISAELDAGPLRLVLKQLDRDALDSIECWAPGETLRQKARSGTSLELEFTRSERQHYLVDPEPGETLRLLTWAEPNGGFAMATHGAALLVDAQVERGIAVLARQPAERLHLSLQNLLRVATAWRLARSRSGLLLHAAAIEFEGGAVLLLGHSGAGKTTAVGLAEGRGVLADDVAILSRSPSEGGSWLVHPHPLWASSELPGRRAEGEPVVPAMLCSLRHGPAAAFESLPRSRAAVVVASCAPFLGASGAAFDVAGAAASLARALPAGVLTFAKDQPPWGRLNLPHLHAAAESAPNGD